MNCHHNTKNNETDHDAITTPAAAEDDDDSSTNHCHDHGRTDSYGSFCDDDIVNRNSEEEEEESTALLSPGRSVRRSPIHHFLTTNNNSNNSHCHGHVFVGDSITFSATPTRQLSTSSSTCSTSTEGSTTATRRRKRTSTTSIFSSDTNTKNTNNNHHHPALSVEFHNVWRRKSLRRISALVALRRDHPQLAPNNKKKTAQQHWAMLRDHVHSGRFLLDHSSASSAAANYYYTYSSKNGSHDNLNPANEATNHHPNRSNKNHNSISSPSINNNNKKLPRRFSIVRSLQKEIHAGLEFTVGQCLCAIGLYLAGAVLCFSYGLEETRHQWTIIDSMYFAVTTFTTVGFGDLIPPDTPVARSITSIFALTGVACLGLALGVLGQSLVELETKAMDRAQQDVMTLFATSNNHRNNNNSNNNDTTKEDDVKDDEDELLQDIETLRQQLEQQKTPANQLSRPQLWNSTVAKLFPSMQWRHKTTTRLPINCDIYNSYNNNDDYNHNVNGNHTTTHERCTAHRRKEFQASSESKSNDKRTRACQRPKHYKNYSCLFQEINSQFMIFLVVLLIFSYWIGNDAGWDLSQTLYFAITTATTIGYGDQVPGTQKGRLLTVFLIPFAVAVMGILIQRVAETMLRAKQQRYMTGLFGVDDTIGGDDSDNDKYGGVGLFDSIRDTSRNRQRQRQRQRELTVMDLEAMDADGDGNVDWTEFLEFMLVAMKKVDEDLLWQLRYQFDALDIDDTGVLSKENLISMARRKLHQTSRKLQLLKYKKYLLERAGGANHNSADDDVADHTRRNHGDGMV